MATGLNQVLEHLRRAFPAGGDLTDSQLLACFVATRDEAAFATLVHRHGPMVLGVCRRVLRHAADAEDAFQATFLVLARKAAAVRRGAVASWLYAVAYRTALQARARRARRRAHERQVEPMPHAEVLPPEVQDWRPLLDRELSRLGESQRAVLVLCDLEGRPRKEAARLLGLPEGTLSSRLARARQLLARRLARQGVSLPAGALVAALAEGASAAVPARLVVTTVRAAVLLAAGRAAAVTTPAAALMREVLRAMLLTKLKPVVVAMFVVGALGAGGLVYRAAAEPPAQRPPLSEVEALRRENELLKLNLEVVLEKVRAQQAEVHGLKGQLLAAQRQALDRTVDALSAKAREADLQRTFLFEALAVRRVEAAKPTDPVKEMENALKALREARDKQARQRAVQALEKALGKLKEQPK
jgi:RNA polymerase sigma factor (sigma-70 family)